MSEDDHKAEKQRGSAEAGLVYFCSILTGVGAVIGACIAVSSNEYIAGGIFMLAASMMFGLLANAMFRN
ncbi:hypothetical protein Pan241w_48510 [Gimesia alba]|uniref:Uncharacterized protein n=1 Tax=Gimesia alba TaxID=2527973 RepID=A0A517RLI6_9PLAN|nr:hypothetical protein [Gimesia alba]QDT44735.1 hypothetical protein Pan241w_48510 [Gimesia alba]